MHLGGLGGRDHVRLPRSSALEKVRDLRSGRRARRARCPHHAQHLGFSLFQGFRPGPPRAPPPPASWLALPEDGPAWHV